MDSLFEEGKIRVPLAAIRPAEQQCDQTHDLTAVLRDPTHLLACSISSHGRDALLRWLHCDSEHLRKAETPPLVQNQPVTCTYARHSLDQAKAELGENYTCNVHLYCVPPTPCKSCDGDVFRNVRFYMARADPRGIAVAQAWMNTLTDPKRHALALMLKRPNIMSALDRMLPFPGHWKGLQLGNWAKHLAAHIDPAIDNYWTHIKDTWVAIMAKDESMYHLVTTDDVTRLQHRAPAWSSSDRRYIQDAFASHQLFPLIQGAEKRDEILQNILRLQCVIPSIQTFHENMRYIAIGAKILEKLIQTPRRSRKPKDSIEPRAATLFENLACDWKASERSIQIAHERYAELPGPADPYVAGLVLLLAALRYFPHLSAEKPLLGHEKEESRSLPCNLEYTHLLCKIARRIGFSNKKIQQGCAMHCHHVQAARDYNPPLGRADWRAGKPSIVAQRMLERTSFFHQIYAAPPPSTSQVSPFHVQSDLIRAFFPYDGTIPTALAAEVIQFTDTEDAVMSDADSVDVQSDVNDVDMEDNFGKGRGGKRALQKHRHARTGPVHRAQAGGKQGEVGSTTTVFGVKKLGGKGDSSNAHKRKLRNQLKGGRVPVTEKSVAPVASSGFEIPDMQSTMAPIQISSSTTQRSLLLASPTKDGLPSTDAAGMKSAIAKSPSPAIPDLAPYDIEIPGMRSSLAPIHMDSMIQQRQLIPGQSPPAVTPEPPAAYVNSVTTVPPRVDTQQAAEDDNTTETHGPSQSDPVLAPGRKRQIEKSRALSEAEDQAEDLRPGRRQKTAQPAPGRHDFALSLANPLERVAKPLRRESFKFSPQRQVPFFSGGEQTEPRLRMNGVRQMARRDIASQARFDMLEGLDIPDFVAQNRENNREFAGTREPDDFLVQQDFASDSPITVDVAMDSGGGDLGVDIPDINSGDNTSPPGYASSIG